MDWTTVLHDTWWLLGLVVLLSLGSLLLLPLIVINLPADYFVAAKRRGALHNPRYPLLRPLGLVLKNLLGLVLMALGIVMLVLPGQGVLTMLSALVLLDFPGKYRCERWLASRERVFKALNWLRQQGGKPALLRPVATS